jgi:hypothetical protein
LPSLFGGVSSHIPATVREASFRRWELHSRAQWFRDAKLVIVSSRCAYELVGATNRCGKMGTARFIFAHGNARIPMICFSLTDSTKRRHVKFIPEFWTKILGVLPGSNGEKRLRLFSFKKIKSLILKENTGSSCRRSTHRGQRLRAAKPSTVNYLAVNRVYHPAATVIPNFSLYSA